MLLISTFALFLIVSSNTISAMTDPEAGDTKRVEANGDASATAGSNEADTSVGKMTLVVTDEHGKNSPPKSMAGGDSLSVAMAKLDVKETESHFDTTNAKTFAASMQLIVEAQKKKGVGADRIVKNVYGTLKACRIEVDKIPALSNHGALYWAMCAVEKDMDHETRDIMATILVWATKSFQRDKENDLFCIAAYQGLSRTVAAWCSKKKRDLFGPFENDANAARKLTEFVNTPGCGMGWGAYNERPLVSAAGQLQSYVNRKYPLVLQRCSDQYNFESDDLVVWNYIRIIKKLLVLSASCDDYPRKALDFIVMIGEAERGDGFDRTLLSEVVRLVVHIK